MINHVLNGGTLAVSLDGSGIGSYTGGIFSFCPILTVNHAVQIVGVNGQLLDCPQLLGTMVGRAGQYENRSG